MLAVILNQHLIKKERAGRMQKPRIPPHPTTKQRILFLRRMGYPALKKMKRKAACRFSLVESCCFFVAPEICILYMQKNKGGRKK